VTLERSRDVSYVVDTSTPATAPSEAAQRAARIAVYDGLTAPPRVEDVHGLDERGLIEALSSRTYQLSHEAGGVLPYTVIREVVENLIHAQFSEVVVSICDRGDTVRFSDQGPGVADKERAFIPGFSTATEEMKRVIKGVGSGLPVARECLGFTGGTITLEDNLGKGTVVTLHLERTVPAEAPPVAQLPEAQLVVADLPKLSLRQKQVLSLVMELGAVGPSVVSRELGVGLSTAYRDLSTLEGAGLIASDDSGKRVLTTLGINSLDHVLSL
jgi:DNA-binding transcriptional ArsR family regulator